MKKITFAFIISLFTFYANSQTLGWDWANTNPAGTSCILQYSATDSEGNLYTCGAFTEPTYTIGSYLINNTSSFGQQILLIKYNSTGALVWARTFVHTSYSTIRAMNTDSNGNLIITGDFQQSITLDSVTLTNANVLSNTIFIAKISPSGDVIWAKGIGHTSTTSQFAIGFDIAIDPDNNILLSGKNQSSLIVNDTTTLSAGGVNNFFLIKFSDDGSVLWAKKGAMGLPPNSFWSRGMWVATDSSGNVYVTGSFTSSLLFETTIVTTSASSNSFLAKYSASGQLQYLKKYGNTSSNNANEIEIDSNDNVYLIGDYRGTANFENILLPNSAFSYSDIFLLKLNSIGTVTWAKKAGGIYNDFANNIVINNNNLYMVGEFNSPSLTIESINLTNGIPAAPINTETGFIAKYDLNGNVIAATSGINTGSNSMYSIAAHNDFIYVAGYFVNDLTLGNTTLSSTNYNILTAKLNPITLTIDDNSNHTFFVYPNPAKEILNLDITGNNDSLNYKIIDLTGRKIMDGLLTGKINIAQLPIGVHIISVGGENVKFIKQ